MSKFDKNRPMTEREIMEQLRKIEKENPTQKKQSKRRKGNKKKNNYDEEDFQ